MKLREISLRNFRSYGDEPVVLKVSDGLTAFVGPNGAGKSTVLDALMWALYGHTGGVNQGELLRTGASEMEVRVKCHVGGAHAILEVTRRHRRPNSTWLEAWGMDGSLKGDTIAETQANIEQLIGPFEIASATWYCAQGQAQAFLDARPWERRRMLGDAVGISGEWDGLHARATAVRKAIGDDLDGANARLGVLQEQARDSDDLESDLWAAQRAVEESDGWVAGLENEAVTATGELAEAQEANRAWEDAAKECTQAVNAVATTIRQIDGAEREIAELDQLLAREPEIEAGLAFLSRQEGGHRQAMTDWKIAVAATAEEQAAWDERSTFLLDFRRYYQDLLEHALDIDLEHSEAVSAMDSFAEDVGSGICPTCRQVIQNEPAELAVEGQGRTLLHRVNEAGAVHDAIRESRDEAPGAIESANDSMEAMPVRPVAGPPPEEPEYERHWERAAADLENATKRIKVVRETFRGLEEDRTRQEKAIAELPRQSQMPPFEPSVMDTLALGLVTATRRAEEARRANRAVHTAQGAAEQAWQASKRAQRASEEVMDSIINLEPKLEMAQLLEEALSPQGARQLLLDAVVGRIEAGANALLETTMPGTLVEFRTLRESGRETLDVYVLDENGYRRWETMSGGEKTRLMFATRVAMSTAAADAHGLSALPLFVFDESFGDQDEEGRLALLQCLRTLSEQVEQVVAVTHDVGLMGQIDTMVSFKQVNGRSVVT